MLGIARITATPGPAAASSAAIDTPAAIDRIRRGAGGDGLGHGAGDVAAA